LTSAFSLISDYFPKERLATALSVYSMGIFIGSGLANIVGGMVVDAVRGLPAVDLPVFGLVPSWRLTFLIVGVPEFWLCSSCTVSVNRFDSKYSAHLMAASPS